MLPCCSEFLIGVFHRVNDDGGYPPVPQCNLMHVWLVICCWDVARVCGGATTLSPHEIEES